MGDLTNNLSRSEFKCSCCEFDTVDIDLAPAIQAAADHFKCQYGADKVIINITGGNRCRHHNDHLRALYKVSNGFDGANTAPNSQHIYGRAADHNIELVPVSGKKFRVDADDLADYYVIAFPSLSVGIYNNGRVHVDTRTAGPAYWDARD